MEKITQEERQADQSVQKYKPNMSAAVQSGNKQELNLCLKQFKIQNGAPNFPALFEIPSANRLPELAKNDPDGTTVIVTAGLTLAIENMNLKRGLTAGQLLDLAEEILDSSVDDNLSFEDLMLFLQGLTRGRYGELYESMDIPKFMNLFGKYRDERWEEGIRLRDAKHEEYKNLGDKERGNSRLSAFDQHLSEYTTKLQAKNDEIKMLRAERNKRFQQDQF